jgi:hypothetical protein
MYYAQSAFQQRLLPSLSSTGSRRLLDGVLMKLWRSSIGSGNMMVEFFSADIVLNVWR